MSLITLLRNVWRCMKRAITAHRRPLNVSQLRTIGVNLPEQDNRLPVIRTHILASTHLTQSAGMQHDKEPAILTGLSSVTAPLAAPLGVRKNNETTSRNNSLILNSNARNKHLCSPAFSRIDACQHNHRYETTEQKGGRDEHCSSRPPIGAHAPRVLFAISDCGAWRPRGTDPRWRQCQPGRPGQPHQYRSSPAAGQATV